MLFRSEEATDDVRALLQSVTLGRCFDRDAWPTLGAFVRLVPTGDILPTRADFDAHGSWNIAVAPLTSDDGVWYALPDVVASALLTGHAPRIDRAVRLTASGQMSGLRPVEFGGTVPIDPATRDPFRAVIEERIRLKGRSDLDASTIERVQQLLKVFANSGAYGILAELNRQDAPPSTRTPIVVCTGDGTFRTSINGVEVPGSFCFLPLASIVTAGARLMLAMLERCVTDASGTYVFCDTDSMAIVATESGGALSIPKLVGRALSWAEVQAIVDRFARLNPYDRDVLPGSILKIEDANFPADAHGKRIPLAPMRQLWCYAIASKRYAFFTRDPDGGFAIVDGSEHGLGHLLDPASAPDLVEHDRTEWIDEAWRWIIATALGAPIQTPSWSPRPAVGRVALSRPMHLKPFEAQNAGKPYAQQIKPFNFALAAYVAPMGHPHGVDPQHFQLVAPFDPIAANWTEPTTRWADSYSGVSYAISTDGRLVPQRVPVVPVRSMEIVVRQYAVKPERKRAGADGHACDRSTVGTLTRLPVRLDKRLRRWIGKESNRLEEAQNETIHDPEDVCTTYTDPSADEFAAAVRPILERLPVSTISAETRLDRKTVREIVRGQRRPTRDVRARLTRFAATIASAHGVAGGRNDMARCARYAAELRASETRGTERTCRVCGSPVRSRHARAKYCGVACRQRAHRRPRRRSRKAGKITGPVSGT